MTKPKGIFIDIEGGDGTGKGTQFKRLVSRLKKAGQEVVTFDFPQYGKKSAELVEKYLRGEFGPATEFNPMVSSVFYAIDRRSVADKIAVALGQNKIVVTNRFSTSNMAHQGSKLETSKQRLDFYKWVYELEHETLNMPFPDIHLILNLSAEIAQQRVLKKDQRSYTDKKLDSHEADLDFLKESEAAYLDLIKAFPGKFVIIECLDTDGRERTIDEIHEEIWQEVNKVQSI